ncbi:MAG: hypothetical protein V1660_02560 [archaeon]
MKNLKQIIGTGMMALALPAVLAGCGNDKTTGKSNSTGYAKSSPAYTITVKSGDNLSFYLGKEGYPIDLNMYTKVVKALNYDNKQAFVNYDGGQIRDNREILLPDLNNDGKVGGKTGKR